MALYVLPTLSGALEQEHFFKCGQELSYYQDYYCYY